MKRYSRNKAARRREAHGSARAHYLHHNGAPYTPQVNPFRDEPRHTMFANEYHRLRVAQAWVWRDEPHHAKAPA